MHKPTTPAAFHYPHNEAPNMGHYNEGNDFSPKSASQLGNRGHARETNIPNSLTSKDWALITLGAIAFVGASWVTIVAISVIR